MSTSPMIFSASRFLIFLSTTDSTVSFLMDARNFSKAEEIISSFCKERLSSADNDYVSPGKKSSLTDGRDFISSPKPFPSDPRLSPIDKSSSTPSLFSSPSPRY